MLLDTTIAVVGTKEEEVEVLEAEAEVGVVVRVVVMILDGVEGRRETETAAW